MSLFILFVTVLKFLSSYHSALIPGLLTIRGVTAGILCFKIRTRSESQSEDFYAIEVKTTSL